MKYTLPGWTVAAGFVFCALCAVAAAPSQAQSPPAPPQVGEKSLLSQAAEQCKQYHSLAARIRQSGEILGHPVNGQGHYLMLNQVDGPLLSLELKLSVGGQTSVVQQVRDERFLWVRRDFPSRKSVVRVDLNRLADLERQQQRTEGAGGSLTDSPLLESLGIDGLAHLLETLDQHFEFGQPQPSRLGNTPMWRLEGGWRKDKLAKILPAQAADIAAGKPARWNKAPRHVPDRVVLLLARNEPLPLFPFRIEYHRTFEQDSQHEPMLKIELLEVRKDVALDRRYFTFPVGDQEIQDATDDYIAKLGLTETKSR